MQLHNRVVARFADGHIVKGTTQDFAVTRDFFHVVPAEPGAAAVRVNVPLLKDYNERKAFDKLVPGRKLQVTFRDGEVLVGSSTAYDAARPGFFMTPADPKSNNDRIYVVMKAVRSVAFIQ
jgi:hypothetical protein